MLPGSYPLTIYRGDTRTWRFRVWSDAAHTVPIDLTGSTVSAQIRQANSTNKPPVVMTCALTAPNIIDVTLPAVAAHGRRLHLRGGNLRDRDHCSRLVHNGSRV